jgi:hypothetical protein
MIVGPRNLSTSLRPTSAQHAAPRQHVAVVDHHAFCLRANVRKLRRKLVGERPMGGGLPSRQQAGPRKEEDTPANSGDDRALAVLFTKPGDQRAIG